jgi:potassium voltage-gated channel Shal-related subfamily D protein 2
MNRSIPLSEIRTSPSTLFLHEETDENQSANAEVAFPHSLSFEVIDKNAAAPTHPKWKRDLFALLEEPTSSQSAFLVHVLTTTLIVLSSLVTVFETIPAFHEVAGSVWFGFETTLVVLFTVEYIGRCVAWSKSWMTFLRWVGCESARTCIVP